MLVRMPYARLDDVSDAGESALWGFLLKFPLHFTRPALKVIEETTTEKSMNHSFGDG